MPVLNYFKVGGYSTTYNDGEVYSDPIAIRATTSIDVTWEIDWTRPLTKPDMALSVWS